MTTTIKPAAAPATPLPWYAVGVPMRRHIVAYGDDTDMAVTGVHDSGIDCEDDCNYIVHACNAYPRLLEENERLKEALRCYLEEPHTVGLDNATRALLRELEGA